MADRTDAEIALAEARGRELLRTEPRVDTARYDRAAGRIVIELVDGRLYGFPTDLVQDLRDAAPESLAVIEIDGLGLDLHWPRLDVDLYVPALVAGVFGTRDWMRREAARTAGQTKSPAKAEAARANGAKGGRPRKSA